MSGLAPTQQDLAPLGRAGVAGAALPHSSRSAADKGVT